MKQIIQSILVAAIFLISLNHSVSSENSQRVYAEDLQSHLSAAGYDIGKVDGEWGQKSKTALIKYLQDNSFPTNTKITAELFKAIRASLGDKAPLLKGEGENSPYFIKGIISNWWALPLATVTVSNKSISEKLKARKTINAFLAWNTRKLIKQKIVIVNVKSIAEMRLALKKRKSLKRIPLKTSPIIKSDYGLHWTANVLKNLPSTITLNEVYWNYHYVGKSWSYYPGIEPYLTKRNWDHDKEYGKTVATKIIDPKFQDFIVGVIKAKMQSSQSDGIMLDWWHDNHTNSSGYSKHQVRKARIEIAKKLRNEIGPDKIILGNVNWKKDKATVPYINGVFLELWKKDTKRTYRISELKKIEDLLSYYEKNLQEPKLIALDGWRKTKTKFVTDKDRNTPENRKMAKLLTAMSVVIPTNGYILYGDNNPDTPNGDHDHMFYDFYKFDIGKPTSGYTKVKSGVGYKEHKQGFIAYNITSKPQKITRANGQKHQVEAKSGLFCKDVGSKAECLSVD